MGRRGVIAGCTFLALALCAITGGNVNAGQSGSGGSLNGGVRHQGSYNVAPNFTVNGGHVQGRRRSPSTMSSRSWRC